MGYDIGPRISIAGEKEFNNQIKSINNSIKEYGSEMKVLTEKFKDNAQSQEALTEKTKLLEKQYEAQKKKSDVLQKQYDKEVEKLKELAENYKKTSDENGKLTKEAGKAEEAFNRQAEKVSRLKVSMNETEGYAAKLENSIRDNKTALSEMESGLRDVETGLKKVDDAAEGAGDKFDEMSKKISAGNLIDAAENLSGVGDKIIEVGEGAVESFTNIEDATKKVNSRLGEIGEEADKNGRVLKSVYEKGLGDSMDAVADAVIKVKDNIKGLNEESLDNITSQALTLEDIYDMDMSESMRGVSQLMNQFEMTAEEAMDYLVAGAQNGLNKTDELGDNITEFSGKFAQAGYSASEYFQLLQNGSDGGAYNLSRVNDAINEVTTRLADGTISDAINLFSEETANVFEAWKQGGATQKDVINSIVADIQGCTNQQEKMNMAATAFGTMAEDGNTKFIESLLPVGDAYDDVTGKAQKMSEDTETSSQKMEASIRKIKDAFAPLGESVAEIIEGLTPAIEGLTGLIERFADLPEPVQGIILGILGLLAGVAKLAPVLASLKAIGVGAGLAQIGTVITGTVIPAIGAGLAAAAPVIGIVAAIAAAIAAVILIIKNWGKIMEWAKDTFGPIIEGIKGFFTGLGDKVGEIKENIGEKITNMCKGAADKFDALKAAGGEKFDALKDKAGGAFSSMKESAGEKIEGMKEKFFNGIGKIGEKVKNAKFKLPEIKVPDIKLPHFSVTGKFGINPPSWPKFDVEWKKQGGILSGAQIFGKIGDKFLGGGEAGKEAVLPLGSFYENLRKIFSKALDARSGDYSGVMAVTVYNTVYVNVGNKAFKEYIVKTSKAGIEKEQTGNMRSKGR